MAQKEMFCQVGRGGGPSGDTGSCPSLPAWALARGQAAGCRVGCVSTAERSPSHWPPVRGTTPQGRGPPHPARASWVGPPAAAGAQGHPRLGDMVWIKFACKGSDGDRKPTKTQRPGWPPQEATLAGGDGRGRPCALAGQGAPNLHEPRSPNRGSRRLWELNSAFLSFPCSSSRQRSGSALPCPALVAFCSTLVLTVKLSFRVATQEAAVILLEEAPLRPQHPQALGFSGGEGQHRTVTTGVTAKSIHNDDNTTTIHS